MIFFALSSFSFLVSWFSFPDFKVFSFPDFLIFHFPVKHGHLRFQYPMFNFYFLFSILNLQPQVSMILRFKLTSLCTRKVQQHTNAQYLTSETQRLEKIKMYAFRYLEETPMDWKTWKSNYFRRRPRINKNKQMFFLTHVTLNMPKEYFLCYT